jgi:hypothetical protein
MSDMIKPGNKGDIMLVHAEKTSGQSIIKMDSRAMALFGEGLGKLIQAYELLTDAKDLTKLEVIKELDRNLKYCREASLPQ